VVGAVLARFLGVGDLLPFAGRYGSGTVSP
jgi:hypothetical protein